MKIYKTNEEVKKDIVDGVLDCKGDVKFECNVDIEASINARDINAWNINAGNINAGDINAWNINAGNINAGDINAWDINALDINAWNINAWNIDAWNINAGNINAEDINAWNINAGNINAGDINAEDINAEDINAEDINAEDIKYNAFCNVYNSIKCKSIKAKREIHNKPVCLEGKLEIIEKVKDDESRLSKCHLCNCLKLSEARGAQGRNMACECMCHNTWNI